MILIYFFICGVWMIKILYWVFSSYLYCILVIYILYFKYRDFFKKCEEKKILNFWMFFDILDVLDVNVLYFFYMLFIKKKEK